ncbi:MAG: 3-hydroxyacyl-CoA dehydrogenase family protein [Thermoleophilia bacterium]|nr:3-hydroxyacyl-CoA dehydrogenase family protein [Thermoleophilia bacterium]
MDLAEIKNIAIYGAGTMGPGLAQVFATAGYDVTMYSRRAETLEKALSVLRANLGTFVEEGLLSSDLVPEILARVRTTQSLDEAGRDADFVIETIVEKLDAKKALYEAINDICPPDAIITSNTSYLNIYEVMPARRLPHTVIAHWFAPPHIVPLVEVVKGDQTSEDTVQLVVELLRKVDRVPVIMEKFVPGFCVNRFLRIIGREVFFLLDNGYMKPDQLDLAVKASIIPRAMVLGFVQRYDFTGLDLSYGNLQNPDFVEPPIDNNPRSLRELVEQGHLGVKTGKGFFDYSDRPLEEVLRERDKRLIKVFQCVKDLIDKPI